MSTPVITDLNSAVRTAIQAPSVHNTQPWLFRIHHDAVDVYADRTRQLAVADPAGTALRVSCGAAIFHLRLAIAHLGREPHVDLLPTPGEPDLLARVSVGAPRSPTPTDEELYAAIPRRHSNRRPFLDTAIPLDVQAALRDAARVEGAWLDVIIGEAAQAAVAEMVAAADQLLRQDPAYRAELAHWVRATDTEADGVPRSAAGPAPEGQDLFVQRDFGGSPRAPGRDYEAHPFIAVLGTHGGANLDDLMAGQALERTLLTATSHGLVTSMISQPIDVPPIREQLRLGLRRSGPPQMLLRAGYGVPGFSPPRRPVSEVLLPTVPSKQGL